MFNKLKSIFDKKIEEESEQFDTVQIAISTLMIQTAIYDGIFDEQEKSKILELIKKYFNFNEDQKLALFKIAIKVSDDSNDLQQLPQ